MTVQASVFMSSACVRDGTSELPTEITRPSGRTNMNGYIGIARVAAVSDVQVSVGGS